MASFFLYDDSLTTPGQSTDVVAAGTVGREHAVVDPLPALDASVASEAHAWKGVDDVISNPRLPAAGN